MSEQQMKRVHADILERFKRTRKQVREAEEMAPREAAQLLDGLRSMLASVFAHVEAGRYDEAVAELHDDMSESEVA